MIVVNSPYTRTHADQHRETAFVHALVHALKVKGRVVAAPGARTCGCAAVDVAAAASPLLLAILTPALVLTAVALLAIHVPAPTARATARNVAVFSSSSLSLPPRSSPLPPALLLLLFRLLLLLLEHFLFLLERAHFRSDRLSERA